MFYKNGNDWCPLCTVKLTLRTASLEHAPPKSMGNPGPGNLLVCKKCNNAWGHSAEAMMDREYRGQGHIKIISEEEGILMAGEFLEPRKNHITMTKGVIRLDDGSMASLGGPAPLNARISRRENLQLRIAPPGLNQLAERRAWIKSMYLSIGAATQGGFWRTKLGRRTRESLGGDDAPWSFYVQIYKDAFSEKRLFRFEGEEPAYMMVWADMFLICGIGDGVLPSTDNGFFYDFVLRDSVSLPVSFGRPSWKDFNRLPPPTFGGRFLQKGPYSNRNRLIVRLGYDIVEEASVAK